MLRVTGVLWLLGAMGTGIAPAGLPDVVLHTSFERCEQTFPESVQASPSLWSAVFSGLFPQLFGIARTVTVNTGQVVSLRFVAPTEGFGSVETSEVPGLPGGPLVMSISECPGDFRPSPLSIGQQCLRSGASQLSLVWGFSQSPAICKLQAGQTYYLNLAFAALPFAPGSSTCGAASCSTFVISRNLEAAN